MDWLHMLAYITGTDRIVGAVANLGYTLSDQTVGNILRRNGIPTAPARKRTTTWADFIRAHVAVLAGTDFFTVEVLTLRGLVTYYVLFFKHLESRRVEVAGITPHSQTSIRACRLPRCTECYASEYKNAIRATKRTPGLVAGKLNKREGFSKADSEPKPNSQLSDSCDK
jgi:hypothetical protein